MSNQVKEMISQLVEWYADHDKHNILRLDAAQIPEHDLNNVAAMILSQSDDLAAEASGPDNAEFYKSMVPALVKALKMPKNGFENEEFRDVYTAGVRAYVMPRIIRMIDERLEEINGERECRMELVWDRATEKTIEVESRHRI